MTQNHRNIRAESIEEVGRVAQDYRQRALTALRDGRFDLAEDLLSKGEVTLAELIENLRIYQAELVIQNEELQRSQLEREEALARFTAFFLSLPIAEMVIDRQGLIIEANPAAERLFGLRLAHLHQHFFARMVDERDRGQVIQAWSRLERDDSAMLEELHFIGASEGGFIGDLHVARLPGELRDRRRFVCAVLDRTEAVNTREDLRVAHAHLRDSEERYRVLAEFSPDWEYWTDPNGQFIYVSPACVEITGYSADEILEDPDILERLIHPEDRDNCLKHFRSSATDRDPDSACLHFRLLNRFGVEHWIEHICRPVFSADGVYLGRRGVNRDITERQRAEARLLRSEALLRATGRLARVGGWELDLQTDRLLWTEMVYVIHEVDASFVPSLREALAFFHAQDRPRLSLAIEQVRHGGPGFELELRLTTARGRPIWVKVAGDPARATKLTGSLQDITERVEAERALHEGEEQYRALFESASEGMGVIRNGRFLTVNQAAARMLGYPNGTALIGRRPSDLSPERQPDGQLSDLKEREMLETSIDNGTQQFEWDHLRADGSRIPVQVTLVRFELRGEPALFVTWLDLSPERAAREREMRSRTVFENTSEGILITDPELRILAVNPAFTEITGYSEQEVLGQTPRLLKSGRHDQAFYQAMWAALKATGQWRGEFWNRRKDGEIYPQLSTISVVRGPDGEVSSYIGVFGDLSKLKHSEQELYRLAHHDALTGLPNRALLRATMEQSLRRARRAHGMVGLLFLDLDLFKNVNDTLGHPVGDALLRKVAEMLRERVREANSIARIGGDEFIIVIEDLTDPTAAAKLAQRLLELFAEPFMVDDRELYISASIGISIFPGDGRDMDALLSHADVAMYQAKEHGRNTYRFFESTMTAGAAERLRLETALRGAMARGELSLHFQPQVHLADAALVGVEALLRWQHPRLGQVSPALFVPIAEEIGLIRDIGAWVLEQGCRQLGDWDARGLRVPRMAINLSVQQIESPDLVALVGRTLEQTGVTADRLELEITESMLMRHVEQAIDNLHALRALGVTLAIDDFGSGYSSLRYLKRLPIHRLKIDRSFIEHLLEDTNDEAIVRAVLALGRSLGLEILAEGVETAAQADFLSREGCDEAQGYLFARPLPARELAHDWMSGGH